MDNEQKQREFLEAIQEVNRLASEIDKKLAEVFKKGGAIYTGNPKQHYTARLCDQPKGLLPAVGCHF
jgi:hypothetical protein